MSLGYRGLVDNLTPEYQRLEKREKLSRKYTRPGGLLEKIGSVTLLITLVVSFSRSPSLITEFLLVGYGLAFGLLGVAWFLGTRAKPYSLDTEEVVFVGVYRTLLHLLDCLADPLPKFRKQAESELRRVTRLIDQNWTLDFRLAKEVLSPVVDFRKNLKKLLSVIPDASSDQLVFCLKILSRLGEYLLANPPSMGVLSDLNVQLSTVPEGVKPTGGVYSSTVEWFKVHSMFQKGTLLVATLSSGPVLFILTTSYGFDRNVSLLAATTASVGLTGAYMNYLRKK